MTEILFKYKCKCCTGTFYVPMTNTSRDAEMCPFCGTHEDFELVDTITADLKKELRRK